MAVEHSPPISAHVSDIWPAALPSFEQIAADQKPVPEPAARPEIADLPDLSQAVIEKPQLCVRRPNMQLDFSYLQGEAGDAFAELLGHKIIDVPPMTVVRVYSGEYGSGKDTNGNLQTGGLQQCIAKLDRALVKNYPITVHVIHTSETESGEHVIASPEWSGKIHVHSLRKFGSRPEEDAAQVRAVCAEAGADLVHLHITDSRLAALIAENAQDVGLAVTFHNGLQVSESDSSTFRSSDIAAIGRILASHVEGNGLVAGTIEALREIGSKVSRRLFNASGYAPEIYDRVVEKLEKSRFFGSGLISVSKHSQSEFQDRPSFVVGDPMDSFLFNPADVTSDRKAELRQQLGITEERVLLCHGRVCALKGQHYLPDVAAHLKQAGEHAFKIIILGPAKGHRFLSSLKADIAARGLEDRFILIDGRPNEYIRDVLAITDVMVFPTRIEALGGAGIEAGLMGVPVVGHRIGGVPEVVEHGESGYLVEVGDTRGMAKHISTLLADEALRTSMGKVGRERGLVRFDADTIATRYIELVYGPQVFV